MMVATEHSFVAAHFLRQQDNLQKNIHKVGSNEAWIEAERKIRGSCGAFVFWRRTDDAGSRFIGPIVHELSRDNENAPLLFFEVNIDLCPEAKLQHNIELTPAFTTFHHGRLVSASTGVSQNSLHELFDSFCKEEIDTCRRCGRGDRLQFMTGLDQAILTGPLSCSRNCVPSGQCAFDLDPFCFKASEMSAALDNRAHFLVQKLQPHSQVSGEDDFSALYSHVDLVLEFLAARSDEGFSVDGFAQVAQEWLTEYLGKHPSCWEPESFRARDRLVRMAICRRAARVELWLLQNLSATSSCTKPCELHDRHICQQLRTRLDFLQDRMVCSRQCSACKLPCGLLRRHAGPCECGADHKCHYMANSGGQCEGCAGHAGLHQFPAPPPPPRPSTPPALPALTLAMEPSIEASALAAQFPAQSLSRIPTHAEFQSMSIDELRNSWLQSAASSSRTVTAARAKLPAMSIDELRNSWQGTRRNSDSSCSICFEPLGAFVEELYCKHAFHAACLSSWVNTKKHCPLCRMPVDNDCCKRVAQSALAAKESRRTKGKSESFPAPGGPGLLPVATMEVRSARRRDGITHTRLSSSIPAMRREPANSSVRTRAPSSSVRASSNVSHSRSPTARRQPRPNSVSSASPT